MFMEFGAGNDDPPIVDGILSHFYTLSFRLFMYMIYQMTVINNMYYRSVCLVHPLDVFPEEVASGSVGPKSPLLAG